MVSFLKENGYPATIHIETEDFEDKLESFKGYHSVIKDEGGNILSHFYHTDLRARIHWANGYFMALRKGIKHEMPLSIN
mgnify:CR=1 FL=1